MRHLLLLGALTLAAAPVLADEPDSGRNLAERWCAVCHVIGPDAQGGDVGPSFSSVAIKPDLSDGELRAWLTDPHDPMPRLDLTDGQIEDIIIYIRSLAEE